MITATIFRIATESFVVPWVGGSMVRICQWEGCYGARARLRAPCNAGSMHWSSGLIASTSTLGIRGTGYISLQDEFCAAFVILPDGCSALSADPSLSQGQWPLGHCAPARVYPGFRPQADTMGEVARSSRPVATVAKCRRISSGVARPAATRRPSICWTVARSSSLQAGPLSGK
jgi:hypothetical protein